MTLLLETESHGIVESGFRGAVQFIRLGEYVFATKHICELTQQLAKNPAIKEGQIISYKEEKYLEKRNEHLSKIFEMCDEEENGTKSKLEKEIEQEQGNISLEEDLDLNDEAEKIFLKVEDDFSSITIGQYKISALHFGDFVYYVARGGFMGWFNQVMPSYAKETMKALKDTDNELFKYIRKELEDS